MFGIFKKKKKNVDTNKIIEFNKILKIIEDFVLFEEFDKAEKAIKEVILKENESFKIYIEKIDENEKKEEIKKLKEKISKIENLREKNNEKKRKYELILNKIKKKEEEKITEKKVTKLIGNSKFNEAILLLNNLLEKNINNFEIINFVNKHKKIINKSIKKYKIKKSREIQNNTLQEAQELIGEIKSYREEKNQNNTTLFKKIKSKFNFYFNLKKRLKDKKLFDEINILLQVQNEKNEITAKTKLIQIHSGISKEIQGEKIIGYELYGKIMGVDKISGDSLGFIESKNDYNFFIGDATGHGIRAGFIISLMTKKFQELAGKKSLIEISMEVNNGLKQDLKSGNFITSIFFNINKKENKEINFVGMGHDPFFIFRKKNIQVEKIIPGGLATGIRLIKDINNIKKRKIILENGDILIAYTDGIIEAKNEEGKMYGINRIEKKIEEFGRNSKIGLQDIYNLFIEDLKNWTGGKANYTDDVSLLLLKRDINKDILEKDEEIEKIINKEEIEKKYKKRLLGKSFDEINKEIKKIQNKNKLKNIIKALDILYKTGELPKLKQDCIRYIKEGFIHKKINFYLKKALDNENDFKIKQRDKKMQDKYNILKELYKKEDYKTVINECSNIISKDGNI